MCFLYANKTSFLANFQLDEWDCFLKFDACALKNGTYILFVFPRGITEKLRVFSKIFPRVFYKVWILFQKDHHEVKAIFELSRFYDRHLSKWNCMWKELFRIYHLSSLKWRYFSWFSEMKLFNYSTCLSLMIRWNLFYIILALFYSLFMTNQKTHWLTFNTS